MCVCHASSVVDMLGDQVNNCPATDESHAPYLPVFMVLHILHIPSPTGATHITHKNKKTLHTSKFVMVPEDHPSLI